MSHPNHHQKVEKVHGAQDESKWYYYYVVCVIVIVGILGGILYIFDGFTPVNDIASSPTPDPRLQGLEQRGSVTGCTQEWIGDAYVKKCKRYKYYESYE